MNIATPNKQRIVRSTLAALLCAILAGCFFIPGHFQSELDIRQNGHFTYRYKGEVVFLFPPEKGKDEWSDDMAYCFEEQSGDERRCSTAEVNAKKERFEEERAQENQAGEDIAMLVGFNPLDAEANEKLAADLMAYPGWKQVKYLGQGTFQVEYELSGTLDRDFAFPVIPKVQMAMPFIFAVRSKAGVVDISAAGLASQQLRRALVGQTPKVDQDDPYFLSGQSILKRTQGAFTVTTDGEISATNGKMTAISPTDVSRKVEWTINGETSEAPFIQLRLP